MEFPFNDFENPNSSYLVNSVDAICYVCVCVREQGGDVCFPSDLTPGCTEMDMVFFSNHSWHSVNGLRISIS